MTSKDPEQHFRTSDGIPVILRHPELPEEEREARVERTRQEMRRIYEAWCKDGKDWENNTRPR